MNILRQNKKTVEILTISNFLSDKEIKLLFNLCEKKNFLSADIDQQVDIQKSYNILKDYKFINPDDGLVRRTRESSIKWILWDSNSDWLFKKIISCINEVNVNNYNYILKFVENLQFTQYTSTTKGFYSKHNDCGSKYNIKNFVDIRKLSFSIQLSDPNDYNGGELRFYTGKKSIYTNKEEVNIAKKDKGTIIFFPSHIVHEITPVTKGTRYSLVSWVQGPNIL